MLVFATSTTARIPARRSTTTFVTQLINKEVGKFVFERDPAIFAGALALAQTKTATYVTFKTASRGSIHACANPSYAMADNGVNYSGKGRGSRQGGCGKGVSSCPERREEEAGKCWICDSSSHQKSACPVWDKALTLAWKESGGTLLCRRVPTTGLTRKTRRAGFGPASRGGGYYWGDTCHLSP
jgi:hypothetical protein